MVCMQSTRLRFLDACNFIDPGYTYGKYLEAYGVTQRKGFFAYEWMDHIDKLKLRWLPPRESLYSKLRRNGIASVDYAMCRTAWSEENMETFRDSLVWYNNIDPKPLLEALEK